MSMIHARGRGLLGWSALACAAAIAAACSGSKDPEPLPSQTVSQVTPRLQPPPPSAPIRRVAPTKKSTVKVIDAGGGGSENPKTLVEASRFAKAQKARDGSQEPIAKITDENLHEFAQDGEIIVLDSEPAAPRLDLATPEAKPEDSGDVRSEDYWRTRALELRMGWRRSVDRIQELELESAALRQQFYAEEDPYIRDSQLKPSWDRVLDRLEELRDRAGRYEQELELFVAEGRRTGALQGWLNQGWELEPTAEERDRIEQLAAHQSVDPPILDEDDD